MIFSHAIIITHFENTVPVDNPSRHQQPPIQPRTSYLPTLRNLREAMRVDSYLPAWSVVDLPANLPARLDADAYPCFVYFYTMTLPATFLGPINLSIFFIVCHFARYDQRANSINLVNDNNGIENISRILIGFKILRLKYFCIQFCQIVKKNKNQVFLKG